MKSGDSVSQQFNPLDENGLKYIAKIAFYYCSKWFGSPIDPERPYTVFRSPTSVCAYTPFGRQYLISVSDEDTLVSEVTSTIGHEMYHRVTMRREGLHKEPWVSEMLAFLASQWFLQTQGLTDYAKYVVDYLWSESKPVSVEILKSAVRRGSILTPWRRGFYPPGFGVDVAHLALALEVLVQANSMTRMVGAKDLDTWIRTLPRKLQVPVKKLLVPTYKGEIEEDGDVLYQYGYACQLIGHKAEAVKYYRKALIRRPEDSVITDRLNEMSEV